MELLSFSFLYYENYELIVPVNENNVLNKCDMEEGWIKKDNKKSVIRNSQPTKSSGYIHDAIDAEKVEGKERLSVKRL